MKLIHIKDLNKFEILNKNENEIEEKIALAKEVSSFLPAIPIIHISDEDGKLYYEYCQVVIQHPKLIFVISYDEYRKKYSITCENILKLKNVSHGTIRTEKGKFLEPVEMGKLSLKKIQAWIEYYKTVYENLSKINEENKNKIAQFLKSIEGMPVKWYGHKSKQGSIVKNGIEFIFEIMLEYVSTKIKIHYTENKDIDTFLKLSDNKYN